MNKSLAEKEENVAVDIFHRNIMILNINREIIEMNKQLLERNDDKNKSYLKPFPKFIRNYDDESNRY